MYRGTYCTFWFDVRDKAYHIPHILILPVSLNALHLPHWVGGLRNPDAIADELKRRLMIPWTGEKNLHRFFEHELHWLVP
jgi:hypothetical protein